MNEKYLYLFLNAITIAYPLAQSYEHRIRFLGNAKALFWAILIPAGIFIAWDIAFTNQGVWGFNDKYLCGIWVLGLPIEEWLFFITVPFACLFIYEVLAYFLKRDPFQFISRWISAVLILMLVTCAAVYRDNLYTLTAFSLSPILIASLEILLKVGWLSRFYFTWLVCLIPFFIVNGALTGAFTTEPVVWYNPEEFMGVRLFTIPLEDSIYLMGLLLLNFTIYLRLKKERSI